MRKFGKDAPEFMEFQIEGSKKTYKIPLAASLPVGDLMAMKEAGADNLFEVQVKILRKHIGDVVDDLPIATVSAILKAWGEESNGQGASVGES